MVSTKDACEALVEAMAGTNLAVTFDEESTVEIYWCGVIKLNCEASKAAKAIQLFKQLEALGAKDC
jgi:hypothetical protein